MLPILVEWTDAGFFSMALDGLSKLILLSMVILASLIAVYALSMKSGSLSRNFSAWYLITLGFSCGAVLSNNLLFFLVCWGILGITLYQLIPKKDKAASEAAKKTLIMIGASDGVMILGVALIWRISGSLQMDQVSIYTSDVVRAVACLALLAGSFTKAGAFPLHTWLPDYAKRAPAVSSAYLPASLDKLLGIYFLARITTALFSYGPWMQFFLLCIGVITIITAVMMALVQHDYKRLLGFHAVSQVGYMILGFGLGSLIGVAAGLFHMLNNAIYKSGLFLSAGAVEQQSGKQKLEDLGGLSKAMPLTFLATLIFALSISGIPPLNGFASKWMIYQGIVELGSGTGFVSQLWILWLGCAVLGSALTLASFIKFTGGIFLGRRKLELESVREVHPGMWVPMLVLAVACIVLGVWAGKAISSMLMPASGVFAYSGGWNGTLVGLMVLVSIILGVLVYLLGSGGKYRRADSFVGGESLQEELSFDTPEFYKSFMEFRWLDRLYKRAEERCFDLYEILRKACLWLGQFFSRLHTGILHDYAIWVFAGLLIILIILIT
jgi:multicomponent Na+:H+ antiporter subunit A